MFANLSTKVKVILLFVLTVALAIATVLATWFYQEHRADTRVKSALDELSEHYENAIKEERELTAGWKSKAEKLTKAAAQRTQKVEAVRATATQVIKQEREANPAFYQQQIPDKGVEQWNAARELMR